MTVHIGQERYIQDTLNHGNVTNRLSFWSYVREELRRYAELRLLKIILVGNRIDLDLWHEVGLNFITNPVTPFRETSAKGGIGVEFAHNMASFLKKRSSASYQKSAS